MPYTTRFPLGNYYEFGGTIVSERTVTTVAADAQLGTITLPTFPGGSLKSVTVDLAIRAIHNTGVGENHIENCSMYALRGGTESICLTYNHGAMVLIQNGSVPQPGGRYIGSTDVKDRFAFGEATTIYIKNAASNIDSMRWLDIQAIARCIIK